MTTHLRRLLALTALVVGLVVATGSAASAYTATVDPPAGVTDMVVAVTWEFAEGCYPGDPLQSQKHVHVMDADFETVTILEAEVEETASGWVLTHESFHIPSNGVRGTWTFVVTEHGAPVAQVAIEGDSTQGECAEPPNPVIATMTVEDAAAIPLAPALVLGGVGALAVLAGGVLAARRRSSDAATA